MIEQQDGDVRYVQFQQYAIFDELRHGVFTRQGGYSLPPHHSLNTIKRSDSVDNVVRNRQLVLQALELEGWSAITLWSVHGTEVHSYNAREEWRTDWAAHSYFHQPWSAHTLRKGDALITRERETVLTLSFADCVPITFYDPIQEVIGIAHGGWRGTAGGVVLATVEAMGREYGSRPQDIRAGIGPAIGPCCYEVSEMVRQTFQGKHELEPQPARKEYQETIRESAVFSYESVNGNESLRLDLQETNRRQLLTAGLCPEHIEIMRVCTCCHRDQYFSHRGEGGQTGRFAVVIGLATLGGVQHQER